MSGKSFLAGKKKANVSRVQKSITNYFEKPKLSKSSNNDKSNGISEKKVPVAAVPPIKRQSDIKGNTSEPLYIISDDEDYSTLDNQAQNKGTTSTSTQQTSMESAIFGSPQTKSSFSQSNKGAANFDLFEDDDDDSIFSEYMDSVGTGSNKDANSSKVPSLAKPVGKESLTTPKNEKEENTSNHSKDSKSAATPSSAWLDEIFGASPSTPTERSARGSKQGGKSSAAPPTFSFQKSIKSLSSEASKNETKSLKDRSDPSPFDDDDDDLDFEDEDMIASSVNNREKPSNSQVFTETEEDETEEEIDLSQDQDLYQKPMDKLKDDVMSQMIDDLGSNESRNSEEADESFWSPPKTPPRASLLETCPMPILGASPAIETQEIIGPSPVKPQFPGQGSRLKRLSSLSGRLKSRAGSSSSSGSDRAAPKVRAEPAGRQHQEMELDMPQRQSSGDGCKSRGRQPKADSETKLSGNLVRHRAGHLDKSENKILLEEISSIAVASNDLRESIVKTASFNKLMSRMTQADYDKHASWSEQFKKQFASMFLLWDVRNGFCLSGELADSIEAAKDCSHTIMERMTKFKVNQMTVSDSFNQQVTGGSGRAITSSDRWNEASHGSFEDSPPFEIEDEDTGREEATSPVLHRATAWKSDTRISSPVSKKPPEPAFRSPVRMSSQHAETCVVPDSPGEMDFCRPKAGFVFKKPTTTGSSSKRSSDELSSKASTKISPTSNVSFASDDMRKDGMSGSRSGGFDFNLPGRSTATSSVGMNKSIASEKRTTTATQFIEDIPTQAQEYIPRAFGRQDPPSKSRPLPQFNLEDDFGVEDDSELLGLEQDGFIDYTKHLYSTPTIRQNPGKESNSRPAAQAGSDINSEGRFIGEARNDGKDTLLSSEKHAFSGDVRRILKDTFGMRSFRPNQLQAVNSALLGNDSFVLMPTGGGKSLCYQLPATVQDGVTVVISPLLSLIHDQVTKLTGMNISADHLSGDDLGRHSRVYSLMRSSNPGPKLLYVTPEKVSSSSSLLDALTSLYNRDKLNRIVIDEAHCVSQWGHDFRPDYKKLSVLRQRYPKVPIMALTATATPRVRTDILFQLKMRSPKWFLSSFNRSNLKYEVQLKKGKSVIKDILAIIQTSFIRQSGIVYCLSQRECEETAKQLREKGIKASPYHAGLAPNIRSKTQDDWVEDKVRIVCATIAFGMGIDKPDVRFVIHQSLPKSIEGYYQESGRAGRDGEPSRCILYYAYSDMHRMRKLIDMGDGDFNSKKIHYENLWQMVRYCENVSDCRRVIQLQYFGEVFDPQRCGEMHTMECDNCIRNHRSSVEKIDITETAKQVLLAVQRLSQRPSFASKNFTINQFVEIWRGGKSQKVISCNWNTDPIYGKGSSYSVLEANRIMRLLVLEGYLWEDMVVTRDQMASAYLRLGNKAQSLLRGECVVLHQTESKLRQTDRGDDKNRKGPTDPRLVELQEECFEELKHLVLETSRQVNPGKHVKGVHEVIPIQALKEVSETLPTSLEALRKLDHLTEYRVRLYGEVILSITSEYSERRMEHLASQTEAANLAREEEEFQPGGEDGWIGGSGGSGGSGRGKSRYFRGKKSGWGYKRRGGGKRKRAGNQSGGSSQGKRSRTNTGSSGASFTGPSNSNRATAARGRSAGSMGLPTKRFGNSTGGFQF